VNLALAGSDAVYEHASPSLLAQQPSEPSKKKTKAESEAEVKRWVVLRNKFEQRINALRMWRNSFWQHWALIARFLLPRRFTWWSGNVPNANSMVRGNPINQSILDSTATRAMRICAAGMMNGLSSPSRPWFKFKMGLPGVEPDEAAKEYFETVEDRLYAVFAGSNFYDSLAQQYEDLVSFGTAPLIIYEDDDRAIQCYTPAAGEYYLAAGSDFQVETLARQFLMTISQIVEMFTLEACPPEVQGLWRTKGSSLEVEKVVNHIIEPNFPIDDGDGEELLLVSPDFPWREVYWVWGSGGKKPLSARGFHEQPHMCPRWATTGNDAYGRSPGMDNLPDIMQLQLEQGRKAEGIEKLVRPPVVADAQLKNQPSSTLPGGVTFVANLTQSTGIRPVYQVMPQIHEMMEDIAQVQQRIQQGFFNDIFLMIADSKEDQTAYEVAKKYEEKLQVLGPIIERQQNENHSLAIKRTFRIMERKGLVPPLPQSLQGVPISIEYISIIALAQRATATAAMERVIQVAGNMAAVKPDILDNIDEDSFIRIYGDLVSVKPEIFRSQDAVAQIRQAKAKAAQQQQAMQMSAAAVQGAQTLSQTNVGGGINALQAALGNTGQAAGNA
jgi:hypothetical protein